MADHQRNCILFIALFFCMFCSSYSYQFVVGGRDGWVVKPSQDYNQWAARMRFQINDTLLFRYKSGSDSVEVVGKDDYDNCNTASPNVKLDDGNSIFKFNRSGPFYFISGNKSNCDQGEKLHVVVLSIRTPPSPPPVPSPAAAPPLIGSSPSQSPAGGAVSPEPAISPPSYGGVPEPATTAAAPPSPSPAGSGPAPTESPSASTTPGSPSSLTSGSPGATPPGSEAPADAHAPPPRHSSAATPCSKSVLLISVLSIVLGVFVNSS